MSMLSTLPHLWLSITKTQKCVLKKGKTCLCEKTITLNCKQLDELIALAQKHNVFFMEAMWMKFIPAFRQAKEWVASGRIGDIKLIRADLSSFCPYNPDSPYDRFYTNSLGGGSLLDLGVYPLTFSLRLSGIQAERERNKQLYQEKGNVDYDASLLLRYENGKFADSLSVLIFLKTIPLHNRRQRQNCFRQLVLLHLLYKAVR